MNSAFQIRKLKALWKNTLTVLISEKSQEASSIKEIQVYDGVTRFGAYKPDEKWQQLFGGVEPLKLSTNPQPYSIERTIRWLTYQVANSLALVTEADKIPANRIHEDDSE